MPVPGVKSDCHRVPSLLRLARFISARERSSMDRRVLSKALFGGMVGAALPGESGADQPASSFGIQRTRGELAAAVAPVNLAYPPYHGLRYGMDTTGKTDCTAQLQAIIDAATHEYHHTVTLPHGIIRIDGVVTIAEGVMIVGEGSQGST